MFLTGNTVCETLAFPEMDYREQEIPDAKVNSCTWVMEHPSYIRWMENNGGILGVRGKPGSGKSTLVKKIIQLLKSDAPENMVQISFFYHRRGAEIQYSQIGMYRTLLYQLLRQVPRAGFFFYRM